MSTVATPWRRAREITGRFALAASVVVFTIAATSPARSEQPAKNDDTMCVKVDLGAPTAVVNGATTDFTWTDGGLAWTTHGQADARKFRVTVLSGQGVETVWGESGAWSGTDIRAVTACYCPEKPTTTTTKPTTTTQASSTSVAGSSQATTEASFVTVTEASTTDATQAPTTNVAAESTTRPTLQVLAANAAQTELPNTGMESTDLAVVGMALVLLGAVLVNRRQPGAHRR